MPNTDFTGRIIFTGTTNGIPNLKIKVVQLDSVPSERELGWGTTRSDGRFTISYTGSYGRISSPEIVIRIYDKYLRLLYETRAFSIIQTTTSLVVPEISLHPNNVSGWLVTNATINPSGTPVNLSANNRIEFFIDNETAWAALTDQAEVATDSINFMVLDFEVPEVITKFNLPLPALGSPITGEKLQDKLVDAANRSIPVRLLMNDFVPDLFGTQDSVTEVDNFFGRTSVKVRYYTTSPLSPMHAKVMIVNGNIAYLIGSPILTEYFDTQSHLISDQRRGSVNNIKLPFHEVNVKVKGPCVAAINETFSLIWNSISSPAEALVPATGQIPESGPQTAAVQVLRTLPGDRFTSIPHGETSILEAYQRAIANAEDFVYIEDQYFTSFELVESLVRRVKTNDNVQIILLLNSVVDIPGYSSLQPRVLNQLLTGVRNAGAQDRLALFTLWSHEDIPSARPRTTIIRNYIHSKVAIVDDKWATVGSANTDGTSLNQTQAPWYAGLGGLGQRGRPSQHANLYSSPQPFRAVELNLAIYNNIADQPATSVITDLRYRLWQEHLGYSGRTDPALINRPSTGWLSLWIDRAEYKRDGLRVSPPMVREPRILPWLTVAEWPNDSRSYLRALDVDVSALRVRNEVDSFNFSTGSWE